MLYLGIDLHRKQMTVSVRDERGEVVLRRQVSTRWKKVGEFLAQVEEAAAARGGGGFVVLLEVCGFEDWLVNLLGETEACREVVLIQPEKRSRRKTDRRDANALSELLWVNRHRLLRGERVQGVRRVYHPSDEEQQDRRLTARRHRLGRRQTQTINQIRQILRRHNLEWDRPTKTFQTRKVRQWLKGLGLGEVERVEMDDLLGQWEMWDRQMAKVDALIKRRFDQNEEAKLLATIVGVGPFTALAIVCRIGPIERFPRGRSLANFFGLTPGSRSSGETERLGSITKEGSRLVRFLLGQLVLHVLRRDAKMRCWYRRIKHRRGSKIARVAVMRRLTEIMGQMLRKREAYRYGGLPKPGRPRRDDPSQACQPVDREAVLGLDVSDKGADVPSGQSTGSSSLGSG
jgi:transposase